MPKLDARLPLPGVSLRYADSGGDGHPIVFLHGAGVDRTMFAAQRDALVGAGYRVVLVDLRGHGASRPNTAPLTADLLTSDIEALVAHLGLHRPVLVGHSLGGNLAQRLVRRDPDRWAAIAVLDSTWNAGPITGLERFALRSAAPVLRLVPARSLPRMMADASAVTPSARTELARVFAVQSKAEFIAVWRATTEFVEPDSGYRVPVPLLLVRGAADRTGNIATAMPRWAAAEGVDEVVIEGAGHVVTLDAPDAVSAVLRRFLDGVLIRDGSGS
ncbi:alpha/beta fold hydrolase [Agromyces sp. NPDC058104]|uniref:alpha/beta fold hydrolase n=1 Tax=Agromyces sp. NPDC058104 TaxID=3346342 RepID=UPI0036DB0BCE